MIMLVSRRSKWLREKYLLYIVIVLAIVSIILLAMYKISDIDRALAFCSFASPAVFLLIDYGFKKLSFSIHGRDYYLWLRGSSDIGIYKFKATDRLFSILMLFITVALPLLPLSILYSVS